MKAQICPTCSCSLVRLGISQKEVVIQEYQEREYSFCCHGCAVMFQENPEKFLEEINNLVVCPSCLAEKPIEQTVAINYQGEQIYFCRCPYCVTIFQKNSDYYMKRLAGEIEFFGVFSERQKCCH